MKEIIFLCQQLDITATPNARMAAYTTFRLGGPCPLLCECRTPEQMEALLSSLHEKSLAFTLVGGGSNVLVSDKGLDAVVVRYFADKPQIRCDGNALIVSGATKLDDVALHAADQGLAGMNFLSGIYGTVGGAVCGNAGAFGRQISECLKSVVLMSRQGVKQDLPAEEVAFGYRQSELQKNGQVVLAATFRLTPGDRDGMLKEREEILQLRRQKHPDVSIYPCAGSFFRNIESPTQGGSRQAAGWFLDQVGAKNLSRRGAAVFDKHANIIVKKEECSAQDVFDLSREMAARVKDAFGLDLVPEVRLLGAFDQRQPAPPPAR